MPPELYPVNLVFSRFYLNQFDKNESKSDDVTDKALRDF